jgi:hypothetical protein
MSGANFDSECGIKQLKFNKSTQLNIFHLRKALKEIT